MLARQVKRPGALGAVVRRALQAGEGGEEACAPPQECSKEGGVAGGQSLPENEGGREEAGVSSCDGEEGGGVVDSPHLFSAEVGGDEEVMECLSVFGGGGPRVPERLSSSSSEEKPMLHVQSQEENEMEASDSAESFSTARKKETARTTVGSFQERGMGGKRKRREHKWRVLCAAFSA